MKKIISVILAVITVFSMLACATVGSDTEQTITSEEKTVATEQKQEQKTEEKKTEQKQTEQDYSIAPLPNIPSKLKHDISFYQKNATSFSKKTKIKDPIVFTGASIIYRWREKPDNDTMVVAGPGKSLAQSIRTKDGKEICINNGFGGSTMYELCYYYKEMIRVFKPKVIVVSGLGNDWTYGYTQAEIMQYIEWFTKQSVKDFPNVQIYYTTIRPTPKDRSDTSIQWIRDLTDLLNKHAAANKNNVHIIDLGQWEFFYSDKKDVGTYKNVRKDLYVSDNTHLQAFAYDYYTEYFKKILDPYL